MHWIHSRAPFTLNLLTTAATAISLSLLAHGQSYDTTVLHEFEMDSLGEVTMKAMNGLLFFSSTHDNIRVYLDPMDTEDGVATHLLTQELSGVVQTIETMFYPELKRYYLLVVVKPEDGFFVFEVDKAAILAGATSLQLVYNHPLYFPYAVTVDYHHHIVYVSTPTQFARFNVTDPQNISVLAIEPISVGGFFQGASYTSMALFGNYLASSNTYGHLGDTGGQLFNVSQLETTLLGNVFPRQERMRTVWKHPSGSYLWGGRHGTDTVDGGQVVFVTDMDAGKIYEHAVDLTFGSSEQDSSVGVNAIRPLSLDSTMVGVVAVSDASSSTYYLMNATDPQQAQIASFPLKYPTWDAQFRNGLLYGFGSGKVVVYSVVDPQLGRTPEWLQQGTTDHRYHGFKNPLCLCTKPRVNVTAVELDTATNLTSEILRVMDTTGATFSFAPIVYSIRTLVNAIVEVKAEDGTWVSKVVGNRIAQSSLDAGNVRIRMEKLASSGHVELYPTNGMGGFTPTVTIHLIMIAATTTPEDDGSGQGAVPVGSPLTIMHGILVGALGTVTLLVLGVVLLLRYRARHNNNHAMPVAVWMSESQDMMESQENVRQVGSRDEARIQPMTNPIRAEKEAGRRQEQYTGHMPPPQRNLSRTVVMAPTGPHATTFLETNQNMVR